MLKKVSYPVNVTAKMVTPSSPHQSSKIHCAQFDVIEHRTQNIELDSSSHRNASQKDFSSSQCKGTYQWLNAPKALYNNRKLTHMPSIATTAAAAATHHT